MATYAGKLNVGGSDLPIGSTLYGTCGTGASTAAKVVTCANFDKLLTGVTIHVKFTYSNTASSPTLNVNSTGAKTIYRYGTTAPSTTEDTSWKAGSVVSFTYDGTYWMMNDWQANDNTTYGLSLSDHTVSLVSGGSTSSVTIPDNNTTYTFADGTNGFTVTPSGGSAQSVTVTPSITNNVTGSGTSGNLAKFNGANTVTDGPALGSDTTKFLRNDGTWAAPGGGGTVTSVATGSGLTGGPVTSSGTIKANLISETALTNSASAATEVAGRVYPVALDKDGALAVNVPWTDTTYTAATETPLVDGTGAVGSSTKYAKEDHVHPTDTSRVAVVDVKNDLTTTAAGYVLDARQGKAIIDALPDKTLSKEGVLNSGTNLNSIVNSGIYMLNGGSSYTNIPPGLTYGLLTVFTSRPNANSSFIEQRATRFNNNTYEYVRSSGNGGANWTAWQTPIGPGEISSTNWGIGTSSVSLLSSYSLTYGKLYIASVSVKVTTAISSGASGTALLKIPVTLDASNGTVLPSIVSFNKNSYVSAAKVVVSSGNQYLGQLVTNSLAVNDTIGILFCGIRTDV